MYSGSVLYLVQTMRLRTALQLGPGTCLVHLLNALWPPLLWSVSLACLVDETPQWLLEGLRQCEAYLPTVLHSSLFLDPPALYPVCKLLNAVIQQEEARLRTVLRHAHGGWSLTKPARAPLTDLDVVTIISRRVERLDSIKSTLNEYARSNQAVPTALAAPVLEKLRIDMEQLEKVLEADIGKPLKQNVLFWWLATSLSAEHKGLRNEREAVQRLLSRIAAVRFTAVEIAARGQIGSPHGTSRGASTTAVAAVRGGGRAGIQSYNSRAPPGIVLAADKAPTTDGATR